MSTFPYDSLVYVSNLEKSQELNNRAARVCEIRPRADGRVGIQMLVSAKKVWVRQQCITPILDAKSLEKEPFCNMSETEKTDAVMYLFAMEDSTPVSGVKASWVKVGLSAKSTVICGSCKRPPETMDEYILAARENGTTPTKFVKREEGTFDKDTGLFFCTDCYITLGCPTGKAYDVKPKPGQNVNMLTEEDKARLLHAGQWGSRTSRSHWADLCHEIKARTGEYPLDWAELIVNGRLFSDAGHVVSPGMRICGDDEIAAFFGM